MALGYCRECGGRASTEAPACPHCGAADPTGSFRVAAAGAGQLLAPRSRDGMAAVLSLFIPGAGQMYKGHVGAGVTWLCFTFLGYLALIIPGLVLHLVCILNASSTDPA